jgi:hypothetical protein
MAHAIMFFVIGAPLSVLLVYGWIYCFVADHRSRRKWRNRQITPVGPVSAHQGHAAHRPVEYQCLTCGWRRQHRWASCGRCNETHAIPV